MKMALGAAAAAMLACALPASAATWVISGGTLDNGTPEGSATFSGTIDYDGGMVTAWNITVTGGIDGMPFVYSNLLPNHAVDDSDGTPTFFNGLPPAPMFTVLDFENLVLAGTSPVTPLTGGEFFSMCIGEGCFPVGGRTITGGTATLAAVPEPATWAMMIGGFGLVGGAMRRRAKVAVRYA